MEATIKMRDFLRSNYGEWNGEISDEAKNMPQPALIKEIEEGQHIDLPIISEQILIKNDFLEIINSRKSIRKYSEEKLSLEELAFLLWTTQGIKKVAKDNERTLRTVPSSGARHSFETYLVINRVDGLAKGLYRYLPLTNQLLLIKEDQHLIEKFTDITHGQSFVSNGAVVFIWSCVPYRMEWRYNISAHKNILLDAGHVCQNLYLACEAIECGVCAVGAYKQEVLDDLLGIDGENELTVYIAPVGKRYKENI